MSVSGDTVPPAAPWTDEPLTRVLAFARRFGPGHAALAMHAAVPLGLAYLQPALAAQAIAAALRDGLSAGQGPDVLRVASLTQALAAPLYTEEKVLLYAAGIERLAAGQTALGVRFLEALGPVDQKP